MQKKIIDSELENSVRHICKVGGLTLKNNKKKEKKRRNANSIRTAKKALTVAKSLYRYYREVLISDLKKPEDMDRMAFNGTKDGLSPLDELNVLIGTMEDLARREQELKNRFKTTTKTDKAVEKWFNTE